MHVSQKQQARTVITLLYKALENMQQVQDLQSSTQGQAPQNVAGYTHGLIKC